MGTPIHMLFFFMSLLYKGSFVFIEKKKTDSFSCQDT